MASHSNSITLSTKLHRNTLSMPQWVHEANDRVGPKPPPPPSNAPDIIAKAPALPPKTKTQPEPDYEVIEFTGQQYSNEIMKTNTAMRSKTPDAKVKCTLCGSNNPWVTCGECAHQIFCASCDDMFHKHPKRKTHVRKTIEQTRPPLPPKTLPGQPNTLTPPVAPPRRSKRGMTPLLPRKDQVNANDVPIPPSPTPSMKNASWHERVSSLKRGFNLMNRPLPDTPKTPTTPSDGGSSRSNTPKSVFDSRQRPPSVTLEKIKSKASATLDRMALLQQRYRQHKEQTQKDHPSRNNSITDQNHLSFDQWSSISQSPSHFRSGSMSSGINSSHFDLTDDSHFNLFHQRQMPPTQTNGQLGNRGMSTSVFNLNQINRRQPEPQNHWMNNQMQQAQSMAQLNCINCSHAPAGWPAQQHPAQNAHNVNDWSGGNQFCSQQQLNRSNLSLNVAAGYMMPHHHGANMMPPPPVFMNQTGLMTHMYPYPYLSGMPVMNPGLMGMPPAARSRATSRAGSRAVSPAMSRKSMPVRRKRTTSYAEDELTDDEDSEQDERRSIISNRSAATGNATRTRPRRLSSASQLIGDDDSESHNVRNMRSKMRERRNSVAKSVQNDWLSDRRSTDDKSARQKETPTTSSAVKPMRVYSDLDSESSGTRALVQAKIQEKLNESTKQRTQNAKGRSSDSDTARSKPQKVSTEVQAGGIRSNSQVQKAQNHSEPSAKCEMKKPESENEETDEEEEEEQSSEEEEGNNAATAVATEANVDDEDKDGTELGPPPSTPDYEWECEFCTYVNEPNVKICLICCKTPSSMPTKHNAAKTPPKNETPKTHAATVAVNAQSEKSASMKKKTTTAGTVTAAPTTKSAISSLTNGMSKLKTTSSGTESDYATAKKKQESLEDVWAALDDNIQATANEVIRNAESKKIQKVSTSCGTSPIRELGAANKISALDNRNQQKSVKETGTSPPPQSISTQTYDILPIRQTEPSVPEPSMMRANSNTTLYNESRQLSRDMQSPLSSFSPDIPHVEQRHTSHRDPETELYILLKEAELYKFTPEELHASLKYCGPNMNPVQWLRENWHKLIQTVQSLATKYGQERAENIIGTISQAEAREALRLHGGNIWQAVSECIEQRQRKFRELFSKGNFSREDVVTALTVHQGNAELALMDLGRTQLKPFLMRVHGSPGGVENESGAMPFSQSMSSDLDNIKTDIHDFLSANASECLQTPNAAGAFMRDHPSTQMHELTNEYSQRMSEASYSYSPEDNSWQLDDPTLSNKNMLKDLETLIGNMEQNQAKQNEQVLRSIESMLGNALGKRDNLDNDIDPEAARILMKSPIITAKSKPLPTKETNKNQLDVKSFVWQHIQEIVPNLVQQVEMELMEQEVVDATAEAEELPNKRHQTPPDPPPVDAEEFIMEEVIAPNIKNATIREELPPEFVYAAEIANFRMEFDRALDTEQEANDDIYTLDEVERHIYKMYLAPEKEIVELKKAEVVSEQIEDNTVKSLEEDAVSSVERERTELKSKSNESNDTLEEEGAAGGLPALLESVESTTQGGETKEQVKNDTDSEVMPAFSKAEETRTQAGENDTRLEELPAFLQNEEIETQGREVSEQVQEVAEPIVPTVLNDVLTSEATTSASTTNYEHNDSVLRENSWRAVENDVVDITANDTQVIESVQNDPLKVESTEKDATVASATSNTIVTHIKTEERNNVEKKAYRSQKRHQKRSQLPKNINRRPSRQSTKTTTPSTNSVEIPIFELQMQKENAIDTKAVTEAQPQVKNTDSVEVGSNTAQHGIEAKPERTENDAKQNEYDAIQSCSADNKKQRPRISRIPVRRALSSKLPRPISNTMAASKSLLTLSNNTNLAEHKTSTSATDLSTETMENEMVMEASNVEIAKTEDKASLIEKENEESSEELKDLSTLNKDRVVTQEDTNILNSTAQSTSSSTPQPDVVLLNTETASDTQKRTESAEDSTKQQTDDEVPSAMEASAFGNNSPANHNNEVPLDEKTYDKDEDFHDAAEFSTDGEDEDLSAADAVSDGELYSIGSGSSIHAEDASKLEGTIQSINSTSEMLLVLENEQPMPAIQQSASNTTVNSMSSQASKPTSSKDFVPSGDPTKQNLSELVEDTQRLIKQMRDEITIDEFESSEEEYSDDYTDEEEFDEGGEEDWDESLSEEYDEEALSGEDISEDATYFDEEDEEGLGEEEGIDDKTLLITDEVGAGDSEITETLTATNNVEQETEISIENFSTTNHNVTHLPLEEDNSAPLTENATSSHNNTFAPTVQTPSPTPTLANISEALSKDTQLSSYVTETDMEPTAVEPIPESEDKAPELAVEIMLSNQNDGDMDIRTVRSDELLEQNVVPNIRITEEVRNTNDNESILSEERVDRNAESNDRHEELHNSTAPAITIAIETKPNESAATIIPSTESTAQTVVHEEPSSSAVDTAAPSTSSANNSKTTLTTTTSTTNRATTDSIKSNKNNIKYIKEPTTPHSQTTPKTNVATSKQKESKIPKHTAAKKVPLRSKSFSGPPGPIGISSVKTIQQEFLNRQKQLTARTAPIKNPPVVVKKKSITEAITKFTQPSTSTGLSTAPSTSAGIFRTHTRIPKKKYHETCFSDDDYETTTTEEEPEPVELRNRKLSVPVFRTYPSIQEPEVLQPEILVRKFIDENLVSNVGEAQIAAALVNMKFQQDVSLWAAKECSDLDQAIALLQQECELCMGTYPMNQIVSMLKCTHKCCKQCAKTYFTVQITDRSINDCNCPYCKLPELNSQSEHEDENLEYFSNLDIFLKNILDAEVHELFQRKLRDRTLLQDPNFKWCIQCSSGFFARPKQKRLICPDCGSVTCSQCRKTWEKQHEGISCEKFREWKEANDPEVQAQGVQEHLAQHGIDCPKCKFRYSLARGGCMHFTCTQCKFEFCYGCGKPFMMGAKCTISSYCAKLGLHAHHPRNCLFYLRDKLPIQLQMLLKENNVPFDEDPPEPANAAAAEADATARCPIQLQKETPKGLVDTVCNNEVPAKHAGMCRTHYVEYLTAKVAQARIDPLPIFDLTDCVQELRRRDIPLPERGPWDTDEIYKNMCAEVIRKNIPLEIK